jgi:hypothetical protein
VKRSTILIFLIFSKLLVCAQLEYSQVYNLLHAGNPGEINNYLKQLANEKPGSLINAYKGALLMREANFEKKASVKLAQFKKGKLLLEAEINTSPDNLEYRFLRLIIQENAPVILKYNLQLNEDKTKIIEGYNQAGKFLQDQIKTYCNFSKMLKLSDLNL